MTEHTKLIETLKDAVGTLETGLLYLHVEKVKTIIGALQQSASEVQTLRDRIKELEGQASIAHLKVGAPIRYTISAAEGENKFYSGELTDEKRRQIMGRPALQAEEVKPDGI